MKYNFKYIFQNFAELTECLPPALHQGVGTQIGCVRHSSHASTLVTNQVPIERRYDVVAEPTMADAILVRLVHNASMIA